ncbi:Baseplate J-like protein [Cardinium endosymbiont of Sogatella furcifera]|uniref:baseplate J/gp47 family protein n=1 Tax=Cardinium endosymbiont of Sogatella furcifera TaxID=650378 RepID=UPI000E0D5D2F|nr:baseplate J/gp47 family protein [Cardinium endosymbiont of Sogatella furcifera]AXI23985.1 Baseplate J-like protein [Cardinium endosymbiont of Sogatella furcifera]
MHIQKKLNILFARRGTCHTERLLPELVDNNLLISDRQFSDHLRFLYLYTDLLAYYDNNNQRIDQNVWRKFLEQDDTVIRSLILHTNIDTLKKRIHKDFLTLRRNPTGIADAHSMHHILVVAQDLIILLDYWYNNLSNEDVVRAKLDAIIHEEINIHISKLYKILQQHRKASSIQSFINFSVFLHQKCLNASLWRLSKELVYDETNGMEPNDEQVIDIFDDFFDAVFNTIYKLKELAASDYFDTLFSQNKEPHVALLIAFLQLLQYADGHLNYIPQRTLEHYYRHVLKFNNNPSIPDQAYVHFLLSPNQPFAFVPEGSLLVAKNPVNGEDILFETKRNITVNKARLAQINTLLITKKLDKEGYKTVELATTTYNGELLQTLPFQLFPTSQNNDAIKQQSNEQLAVFVGSPLFHLAEGMRTIHIKWKFTFESFQILINRNPNKKVPTTAFLKQVSDMLYAMSQVHITTKEGWLGIPEEAIALEFIDEARCLHMTISLDTEVPPMAMLPAGYQGGVVDPGTPSVSVGIRNGASLTGLYILNGLLLETIDLKVRVEGYRGLVLQNQLGIIDNSQIFEPFGPLAKLDSSFYIGSGEIFSKNLTDLKIYIKWDSLPTVDGGFKSYYDAYPTKVNNDDFKVNIAYLNHQHWNPSYAHNRQVVPLFQVVKNNKGSEQLDYLRTISDIDVAALRTTKTNQPLDVTVYGPKTVAGFLKLQLCAPEQAFGHAIYPGLMSSVLVKNAQKKKEEAITVLNEPYTPRIKSITVDYEAEESMVLTSPPGEEEEKYLNSFFHISSFGYLKTFPSKLTTPPTLLPLIEQKESFIAFGIADLNSTHLSIHIAIGENSPDQETQQPKWFYLSDNIWLPLEEAIVVDGTDGLSKSGIMIFDLANLPVPVRQNNTRMTPALTWIKAQFMDKKGALSTIVGVYTQAVAVSRVMDKNGVFSAPILPAKAIQAFQNPVEGIEWVLQPFGTFGGRQFENHQAFYRRVSERLRHKNRAISVWDYERIVLEKFPEIFKVKCINHTAKSTNNMVNPGHITIVVMAKANPSLDIPFVSRDLLTEIKTYIQGVSTPFIKCEVVNPIYEDVKVNVTVKFKAGYEKGLFLNLLYQDLHNFFSPWLFDPSADVQLGGNIPTSKIIDFINNRYYVEGIGNFSILKYCGHTKDLKLDKVTTYDSHLFAGYPWSVMVSSKNHKIAVVDTFDAAVKLRHGSIGDMAISEDFIVGPWERPKPEEHIPCIDQDIPIPSLEEYCLITKKYIRTDHGNH